jgi:hypothetical protein
VLGCRLGRSAAGRAVAAPGRALDRQVVVSSGHYSRRWRSSGCSAAGTPAAGPSAAVTCAGWPSTGTGGGGRSQPRRPPEADWTASGARARTASPAGPAASRLR